MRTWLTLLLVILLGTGEIYRVTEGFRVVTSEDARRLTVAAKPPRLPDVGVAFGGAAQPLSNALAADGRVAIAVFFYARCATVCVAQGDELQQLQERLRKDGLGDRVRLLSISFDAGDDDATLRAYAIHMRAAPGLWQMARVADATERQSLLDAAGIVVVPAPLGQFQHNAAFHIIGPDARLLRVIDYNDPDGALASALGAAHENGRRL